MRLKSHLAVAFMVGATVSGISIYQYAQPTQLQLLVLFFVMLGGVAPDIDARLNGFRDVPFKKRIMLSHRGITHHVAVPFLIAIAGLFCHGLEMTAVLSFAVGTATHIVADMFSPLGVPYGIKYQDRIRLPVYKTGGFSEFVAVIVVVAIVLGIEYWLS